MECALRHDISQVSQCEVLEIGVRQFISIVDSLDLLLCRDHLEHNANLNEKRETQTYHGIMSANFILHLTFSRFRSRISQITAAIRRELEESFSDSQNYGVGSERVQAPAFRHFIFF